MQDARMDTSTPPATIEAFRDRLAAITGDLPRRLRQCAEHVAANTDRIAVSTVADLAAGAGVPPSAMMRFCQIMGFAGFSDLQRLFREGYAPGFPDYATRLRNLKDSARGSPAAILAESVEAGRMSLEILAQSLDLSALDRAVALLARAGMVHIVGRRRSFPVAAYLAYIFDRMAVPAMLHDGVGLLDHRHALRPGDALIAVSFAPYTEETVALAVEARGRGLPVVVLTDRTGSVLARAGDAVLTVTEADFGAFRSPSATIALSVALAVAVGTARGGDAE
jgi:DNA-binding MurR/RpiR family transcriptional regulator